MSETKNVDPVVIRIALEYGKTKAKREAPTYFDLFPSSPTSSSVKVSKTAWTEVAGTAIDEAEPILHKHLAQFLGQELPEVDDDTDLYNPAYPPKPEPEPVEEMYGYTDKEKAFHKGVIHISGNYPERFIFSKDGPEYGNNFLIVCNDGQQMNITTPTRGFIIGQGGRKYVAGEPYFVSGEALGKYPTMEYYADYSTKPTECFVYYGNKVAAKHTNEGVSAMPDTKNVDPTIIRIALDYGLRKAKKEAPTYFEDFPESKSTNSVKVTKDGWIDTVNNAIKELEPIMHKHLESFLGQELPDAPPEEDLYNPTNTDDVEDVPELQIMIMPKTGTISVDGIERDRFVFPNLGPEYGEKLYFKFSNGNTMAVADSSKGFELNNTHHKYQPGYTYSYNPPNPDIPTMEVYLKAGETADFVTMYYNGMVEVTPPEINESEHPSSDETFEGYDVFTTAACDEVMTYRDGDNAESVPQKKCLFRNYSNCSQMPDKFTIVWIDRQGNKEYLTVNDKCGIAMGDINAGYRKYRYIDDKKPHPVAYAPRYFDAVEAKVLVPSTGGGTGSTGWTRVKWGGNPNDSSHDRTWWTKIHGETPDWWRKFPLPKWLDDKPYAVDFRFSSGRTFHVPNTQAMAMDANGPKYRPEEHGESDPRKQHPKIAEEYGKNETWVEFKIKK